MSLTSSPSGAFEALKDLLLEVAQERSLPVLLSLIVQRLVEQGSVALARIWLVGEGDACGSCRNRSACENPMSCLHLVASAVHPSEGNVRLGLRPDSNFRRIPIGAFKVGRVAGTQLPVVVSDPLRDPQIRHRDFIEREGVKGFVGQPLLCRGELHGVLGVFLRAEVTAATVDVLRVLADHTAAAIATARAFAEIVQMKRQLLLENECLRGMPIDEGLSELVHCSEAMRAVLRDIEAVAPTDATVLISGESGTGKELVARAIHRSSRRRKSAFVEVNCAAIAREISESELFGHVKGAYSGAIRDRVGRFEAADRGTLFLDEIGELPLELQAKLLRVLQEGRFERVGDAKTRSVDVRVLAATNRDLPAEVRAGRFRQDLFYRLNVYPIALAPLRERPEDIEPLAEHLLDRICEKLGTGKAILPAEELRKLQAHDWPGNVRELRNTLERTVIAARGGEFRVRLPERTQRETANADPGAESVLSEREIRQRVRDNTRAALKASGGKIYGPDGAAARLGIKPTTLASRIFRMNLRAPDPGASETASVRDE